MFLNFKFEKSDTHNTRKTNIHFEDWFEKWREQAQKDALQEHIDDAMEGARKKHQGKEEQKHAAKLQRDEQKQAAQQQQQPPRFIWPWRHPSPPRPIPLPPPPEITEIAHLNAEIATQERIVSDLEDKLKYWTSNRESAVSAHQAGMQATMTSEDMDAVLQQIYTMCKQPPPSGPGDLINYDDQFGFLDPLDSIKDAVFQHQFIKDQHVTTHIRFTTIQNKFINIDPQRDENGRRRRQCYMSGYAYDSPFWIAFDVDSISLVLSNLTFHVPESLATAGAPLLLKIKEDTNVMLFFKLMQHYGRLESDKNRTWNYLIAHYDKHPAIYVVKDEDGNGVFIHKKHDGGIRLHLTWGYRITVNVAQYEKLDLNIPDQFRPHVNLKVISLFHSIRFQNLMKQVPERFRVMAEAYGVTSATLIMVGKVLIECPIPKNPIPVHLFSND